LVNRLKAAALSTSRAIGGNNARRLVMLPKDKMIVVSSHAYLSYEIALNQKGTAIFSGLAELDTMFDRLTRKFIQTKTFTQPDILAAIMCGAK